MAAEAFVLLERMRGRQGTGLPVGVTVLTSFPVGGFLVGIIHRQSRHSARMIGGKNKKADHQDDASDKHQ
ncbi:MAG: hypothetical protein A2496_22105 [Burkholderiales bacterium RIFOXYC12_FULL_60_6]|nr:MAG: hypothetical protein A2496_22105 [Burkholderiales bacterium RIFOXYC12_FULL_60_6]